MEKTTSFFRLSSISSETLALPPRPLILRLRRRVLEPRIQRGRRRIYLRWFSFYPTGVSGTKWPRLTGSAFLIRSLGLISTRTVDTGKLGELFIRTAMLMGIWSTLHKLAKELYGCGLWMSLPTADAPKKISGVHKRCWRYIANSKTSEESFPKPELQAA